MPARTPFKDLPAPTQAGILCNDPEFQAFAAMRCGTPGQRFNATASAEYLRNCCRIASRKALSTDQRARSRFQALLTNFDAFRGRIQPQRIGH